MKNTETGIFKQANGNFGFIELEDGTSIFVHGSKSRGAFDGDEVTFHRLPSGQGREEARIVRIDKRSTTPKFGIFTYSKKIPIIKLFSPEGKIVIISENRIPFPQPGTTVGVEIAGSGVQTFAILTSIIGRETDFEFEENLLIASTGAPQNFTHRVEQEARSLRTGKLGPHRKDLRGRTIITIDGADAKDLDDAIEVVPTKEGYILSVHIADVAEYVTEGSSLDREALRRGTSIYLADRVIPMLPKELSNELCSLHPGSAKFCLSVDMHIDQQGQVLSTHLYESLIQTAHRGTYEEVQQAYDTGKSDTLSDAVLAMLSHAWKLKHILDKRRFGE